MGGLGPGVPRRPGEGGREGQVRAGWTDRGRWSQTQVKKLVRFEVPESREHVREGTWVLRQGSQKGTGRGRQSFDGEVSTGGTGGTDFTQDDNRETEPLGRLTLGHSWFWSREKETTWLHDSATGRVSSTSYFLTHGFTCSPLPTYLPPSARGHDFPSLGLTSPDRLPSVLLPATDRRVGPYSVLLGHKPTQSGTGQGCTGPLTAPKSSRRGFWSPEPRRPGTGQPTKDEETPSPPTPVLHGDSSDPEGVWEMTRSRLGGSVDVSTCTCPPVL